MILESIFSGIDFSGVLTLLGSVGTGGALGWLSRSNRRLRKAEAEEAEARVLQTRLDSLHATITTLNATIEEQGQRIASLNHALDDKTDRIRTLTDTNAEEVRKLTDKAHELAAQSNAAQEEVNAVNRQLLRVTEERDEERRLKEHYKNWHCRNSGCTQRQPPNPTLKGLTFAVPESK